MIYNSDDVLEVIRKANKAKESMVYFDQKLKRIAFFYDTYHRGFQFDNKNFKKWEKYITRHYKPSKRITAASETGLFIGTEGMIKRNFGSIVPMADLIEQGYCKKPSWVNNERL